MKHAWSKGWEDAKLYCPFCANYTVIEEPGEGDYYYGKENICLNPECKASFTLQGGMGWNEQEN